MSIKCCHPCKPPKRHPGCHAECPEYAKEKAQHDKEKAVADQKKAIQSGLTGQALKGVNRAQKARKHMKGK